MKNKILLISIGFLLVSCCSPEPDNFDDCILEYVDSGMTNSAVDMVYISCRSKFPEE